SSRVSIPSASSERACASAWSTTPPPNDHEYGTTMPTFTGRGYRRRPSMRPTITPAIRSCAAVEELLSAQAEPRDDVLEVGHGGRRSPQHGRIEGTSPGGQQTERDEPA